MSRPVALLLLLIPALAGGEARVHAGLEPLATGLAARIRAEAAEMDERRRVLVSVQPDSSEALARGLQTLVIRELLKAGFESVEPLVAATPEEAEGAARARGAALLVRLHPRLEGAELLVTGDLVPTWINFWSGRDASRARGGAVLVERSRIDAETLALVQVAPAADVPAAPLRWVLSELRTLPARVLALAAGDVDGDGTPELAALTEREVQVFDGNGELLGARDHTALPRASRPPREPSGAIAIGPFGEDARTRLAYHAFDRSTAELLSGWSPDALLATTPLCAGAAGVVTGRPAPGRNHFEVTVRIDGREVTLPFPPIAVAASPRPSPHPFVAVAADGRATLLSAELAPVGVSLEGMGAAIALADLDGDGAVELITTELSRSGDRVRVWRIGREGLSPLFESEALPVPLMAASAQELDGDERDEVVLAGWRADGTSILFKLEAVQ